MGCELKVLLLLDNDIEGLEEMKEDRLAAAEVVVSGLLDKQVVIERL